MVMFLWWVFHHAGVCQTSHPLRMLLLICLLLWIFLLMTTVLLLFPWRNRNLTLSGDIFLLVLAHLCLFVLLLQLSLPGICLSISPKLLFLFLRLLLVRMPLFGELLWIVRG